MLLDGIPTLWTCLSMQKIVPLQDSPIKLSRPWSFWIGVYDLARKKKAPTAGWGVCFFGINCNQKSNSWAVIPKHQNQEVDFSPNSFRYKKWLIPFHAVWGLCWYIFCCISSWSETNSSLSFICFFCFGNGWRKKMLWILVGNLQNLEMLWGVRDFPSFEKKSQKGNRKQQQPQATGILREVPFFREFDDVLSGPGGRFQTLPFQFGGGFVGASTDGKLVVWDSNRGTPENPNPIHISGIPSESKAPNALKPPIYH